MEKNKKIREIGLREYQRWRQGPWRGYYIIGRFLTHRYGLLDRDFKDLRNVGQKYNRENNARIKLKKLEGGIKTDEKDKTNSEEETIEE